MKKGFFLIGLLTVLSTRAFSREIKAVNFVQEGEVSKLVLETDVEGIEAQRFHVKDDKQIILDIKDATISEKWLRGFDTSEFPGSAVFISGYKKPGTSNDIRFAIQLRDNVRSILETKGKTIILNIENRFGVFSAGQLRSFEKSLTPDDVIEDISGLHVPKSNSVQDILQNLTLSGPKKYVGKKISINVKDIPIADLLNMIADTSGFNIILDQQVKAAPPLSLTLTNIPWDQALDTVLKLSKLVAEKNANILIIKTLETAQREREKELEAEKIKQDLEPMVTRVFLINYAKLPDISRIVKDYLSKTKASLQMDERTNSLIVKDTVESIERIKKIIETLDTQTPQVLIEAKIVEANETYSKRLGLSRGLTFGYDPVGASSPAEGATFNFSSAPNAGAGTVLGMTIGVYRRLRGLNFNLELMETESKGRIISTPKVVTQNKKTASITSTEQVAFRVLQPATGNQPALATFSNATASLNLNVTPQVTNDGAISLEINLNKSAFGGRSAGEEAPPDQTTRNVQTNVLVNNGSTVVIGGLYQNASVEQISGIPFLKDLPLVGWLFRTPYAPTTTRNELIIFMTPRIMNLEEAGLGDQQISTINSSSTEP